MKSFWRHCFVLFLSQNLFKFNQTAGVEGLKKAFYKQIMEMNRDYSRMWVINWDTWKKSYCFFSLPHTSAFILQFWHLSVFFLFPRSVKTWADIQKEFWEKAQKSNTIFTSSLITYQWYLVALSEWLHTKNRNIATPVASTVYRCAENHPILYNGTVSFEIYFPWSLTSCSPVFNNNVMYDFLRGNAFLLFTITDVKSRLFI